jgi:hypothetical protein
MGFHTAAGVDRPFVLQLRWLTISLPAETMLFLPCTLSGQRRDDTV